MYTLFQTHQTEIRGVTYVTASYFKDGETIFDRIGHLVLHDYQASKQGAVTSESSLDSSIDFERD
jgi:hypothetical protein